MKLTTLSRKLLPGCLIALFMMSFGLSAKAADYVVITKQVDVNRSASDVWKRVGDYCEISEWLKMKCELTSGTGGVGSVRSLNGTNVEVLVARTTYSYTYWQIVGNMAPSLYHGTLAVESVGPSTSRLVYTLFYDQSAMPSDAVRASEHERLSARFQGVLYVMKELVEAK